MNTLQFIKEKYKLSNKDLALCFDIHPNNVVRYLERNIADLTLNQIYKLRKLINVPYNTLLGEKFFCIDNIDESNEIVANIILTDKNKYNELYNSLKNDLIKELSLQCK